MYPTNSMPGILLLIKITQHAFTTMAHRSIFIPQLHAFLQHLENLLWERFNRLLRIYHIIEVVMVLILRDMNMESVRAAGEKHITAPKDTRPNAVRILS